MQKRQTLFQYWTPAPGDAAYSQYIAQAQPTLVLGDDTPTTAGSEDTTWTEQVVDQPTLTSIWAEPSSTTTPDVPIASTSTLPAIAPSLSLATITTSSSALLSTITSSASSLVPLSSSSSSSGTPSSTTLSASSAPSSSQAIFTASDFANKAAIPTSSSNTQSPFATFFSKLGSSPLYIALTTLVSLAILILILAILAFCFRRRANRKRRQRTLSAWKEEEQGGGGGGEDEKSSQHWDVPPVLLNEEGSMSPAMQQRLSRVLEMDLQQHEGNWWNRAQEKEEDRFTTLPPRSTLRPISGYSANGSFGNQPSLHPWTSTSSLNKEAIAPEDPESRFSSFSTLQVPTPAVHAGRKLSIPSRLNRQASRASTMASVWSNSTGHSNLKQQHDEEGEHDYESSLADFGTPSVKRSNSLSSLSSFQSGRVSNFRRKLSLATTITTLPRSKSKRRSWEILEEEEEAKNRKAELLIRARMRRTISKESTSTNAKTLVGESVGIKGYY